MYRRFFAAVLIALAFAGSYHLSTAAASPRYLICQVEDGGDIYIVIENFGGMGAAVNHCVNFWRGRPRGVEK